MEEKKKNKRKRIFSKIIVVLSCVAVLFTCLVSSVSAYSDTTKNNRSIYDSVYPTPTMVISGDIGGNYVRYRVIDLQNTLSLHNDSSQVVNKTFTNTMETNSGLFETSQVLKSGGASAQFYDFIADVNLRPTVYNSLTTIDTYGGGYIETEALEIKFVIDTPFVYKKGTPIDTVRIKEVINYLDEQNIYYRYNATLETTYNYVDKATAETYRYVVKGNYNKDSYTNLESSKMQLFSAPQEAYLQDYNLVESSVLTVKVYGAMYGDYNALNPALMSPRFIYQNSYAPTTLSPSGETDQRETLQSVYMNKWVELMSDGVSKPVYLKPTIPDVTSWLGTSVANFFDIEIFYGVSLSTILGIIIAVFFVITILKFFAGG